MFKNWIVTVEVNWDAQSWHKINVRAKSEAKAKAFALKEAEKIGKNPKIVSVKEA